jgi:hypothetical protein
MHTGIWLDKYDEYNLISSSYNWLRVEAGMAAMASMLHLDSATLDPSLQATSVTNGVKESSGGFSLCFFCRTMPF